MSRQKELSPEWFQSICPKEYGPIEPDDLREDISLELGEPLSLREDEVYSFLASRGPTFTSSKALYQEFWGESEPHIDVSGIVSQIIGRIKSKLGETAIIARPGFGYVTRRGRICYQVEMNKKGQQPKA